MKKTQKRKANKTAPDDLLPEYRFDYRKARPNRFAGRIAEGGLVVVLDPELSKVFPDAASVIRALRVLADTAAATVRPRKRARSNR